MRRETPLPLLAALLAACGGAGTGAETPDHPTEESVLHELNARAREGGVTETLHGLTVEDPYRSLETTSELTDLWVDTQTERTARALERRAARVDASRIEELLSIGTIGAPKVGGDLVFYTKREGEREQPALYVLEGEQPRATPLVDPETFGERTSLDWFYPSPEGRYVAFGLSENGDEKSTLHVVEVATGNLLDLRIARTKWCSLDWLPDESGFYYTRYPTPAEPDYDAENEDAYHLRVFFHRLGTDPTADPLVYSPEDGTYFPGASVSWDGRWVTLNVFRGWSESDVYLLDRGADAATRVAVPDDAHPLVPVVTGRHSITTGFVHEGRLLLHTNDGAPKYRIATAPPGPAPDPASWTDLVPEGEWPIDGWTLAGDLLVLSTIEDVASRLRLVGLDGAPRGEVTLPDRGEVGGVTGRPGKGFVAVAWSSYLHAPALYRCDLASGVLARVDAVAADLDLSTHELELFHVASADGTEVPVWVMHRQGMERNGQNPVLLYGYGGFNVSLLPGFTRNAIYWLEQGGVYAVANLRGGGEFGEAWHRAGNLENKEHVFEDFEAVIRWLTESNISNPDRIGISGGSNGGLLMGAAVTRAPATFRAAASYVGLYDMVRYHLFPPAELWVTEYGSAEDEAQLRTLLGYSPYHHVPAGARLPAVLIETADHDSRVHWAHSTKFAAALQEANAGDRPVYFYMARQVGHGAGTRLTDSVQKYVRMYAFLEHELGIAGGD